jgi:competence protein ComFC
MNLKSFLRPSSILDLLFPSFCSVCGSFLIGEHKFVSCLPCWEENVKKYEGEKCINCGFPLEFLPGANGLCRRCLERRREFYFDGVEFFTLYSGLPEVALKELKFSKVRPIAYEIGREISEDLLEKIEKWKVDTVVPVPIGNGRLRERGFNQTEEILKGAKVKFKIAVEKEFESRRQSELSKEERIENVKELFKVRENLKREVFGKRVLIFDDVFTTGSTVNEIARVLKESGALSVFVYTVCYTPLHW